MINYDIAVDVRRRFESAFKTSQKNLEKTRYLLKEKKKEFKRVAKECEHLKKLCETNCIKCKSSKKRTIEQKKG
ncbi:MAG: hypothetical protein LUC37_01745 [Prevotella sp.]|nr:hypothetical protein [Prevotella sp.]